MSHYLLAFAPAPGGAQGDGGSIVPTLMMFAAITLIFYFMIIRPQARRQKEHQKMLAELKKGDKVVTSSGIHGTIVDTEENAFIIRVADNVNLKFDKAAVTGTATAPAPKK